MNALITTPVFQLYTGAVIVLGMNLLVLANNTALTRASAKEVVNPEDVVLNPTAEVVFESGNAKTERYRRAHRNALENLPLFMLTGLLLSLTAAPLGLAAGLFAVFVAARLLHSVAYMRQLQPWRTASFAVGGLTQVALLGALGFYVFTA